jgi:hypothetical protein
MHRQSKTANKVAAATPEATPQRSSTLETQSQVIEWIPGANASPPSVPPGLLGDWSASPAQGPRTQTRIYG